MAEAQPQVSLRPQDPVIAAIEPAVKTGAACGVTGFLFGAASGTIRGAPPILFGGVAAIQTFALGSTFSLSRSAVIHAWTIDNKLPSPRDLTTASAIAGALSGGVVGLITRGRSNAIPGAFMFAIFGAAGQHVFNQWSAPKESRPAEKFWDRMGEKSWTPFKMLSNEEYAAMLREKMLKVDVEIAILDDKIAALKQQQSEEVARPQPKENPSRKE